MTDYTVLQPVHLGSGQLAEARKKALGQLAAEAGCYWNDQPSIGRYLIKLADERRNKVRFTAIEISKAAHAALDNWDWEVEADEGRSAKAVEAMKEALDLTPAEAEANWGEEMKLDSAFKDIWDFLYEFAVNTAAAA